MKIYSLGDIEKGTDIGYKNNGKFTYIECPGCKKRRWASVYYCRSSCFTGYCIICRNKFVERCKRKGSQSPKWRGGKTKTSSGYVHIYKPEHPNAINGKYILEHRLFMEQKLGRYLLRDESVHHINGVRDDNRIENLELISPENHSIYKQMCAKCNLRKEVRQLKRQLALIKTQCHLDLLEKGGDANGGL